MKLKDVYPLYLNNKAVQPNTDLKAVSYTHLDVYKRQILTRHEQGAGFMLSLIHI